MSGPLSAQNRQSTLRLFARIALVASPLIVLVGVLIWAGVGPWSPTADAERSFVPVDTVAAGEPIQVFGLDEPQALWAQSDTVDVGSVACESDGEAIAVDGAPGATGPSVRAEPDGNTWVRLTVLDAMLGSVTCDGVGVEAVGVSDLDGSSSGAKGGVFFVVFGVAVFCLGLVARRIARGT